MTTNLVIQYTVVAVLILAALARIVWGMRRKNRRKEGGSCCGCSLADTCRDVKRRTPATPHSSAQPPKDCCK